MQENKILNRETYSQDSQQKGRTSEDEVLVRKGKLEELITEPKRIGKQDISFLSEVCLPVNVLLGNSRMRIKEILELGPGSVVQLDKLPDEPVELLIGDKPFARGEVVIAGERLGIRITELIGNFEKKRTE